MWVSDAYECAVHSILVDLDILIGQEVLHLFHT